MSPGRNPCSAKARRRVVALVLLAIAPKCFLCLVAAGTGVGAALGLGAPEWCGFPADDPLADTPPFSMAALVWCAGVIGMGLVLSRTARPRDG